MQSDDLLRCMLGIQVVRGPVVLPAGSVAGAALAVGADLDDSKTRHRMPLVYNQAPGTAIVAATVDRYIMYADGTVLSLQAAITGALADDASRHVTVDLQKSTGGGAFATVLSAVIDLTSGSVLRTVYSGTIASAAVLAGDLLRVTIGVSGASGNQAQGLVVTLRVMEKAA